MKLTTTQKSTTTATAVLTLEVTYTLNGETPEAMLHTLKHLCGRAIGNGMLTGESSAEIDEYKLDANLVTKQHDANKIAGYLLTRIESGNLALEDIPAKLAQYGLMTPSAFVAEMSERMALDGIGTDPQQSTQTLDVKTNQGQMRNATLVFVRYEGTEVTTIGTLTVRTALETDVAVKEALVAAVSHWVNTTESGASLWKECSADINIGDLACVSAFQDDALLSALSERGVEYLDCFVADCENAIEYDEVLVDDQTIIGIDS